MQKVELSCLWDRTAQWPWLGSRSQVQGLCPHPSCSISIQVPCSECVSVGQEQSPDTALQTGQPHLRRPNLQAPRRLVIWLQLRWTLIISLGYSIQDSPAETQTKPPSS